MSDIKVGDKFRVTHEYFRDSFPDVYVAQYVPSGNGEQYIITTGNGHPAGFKPDEVEKIEPESKYQFKIGDRVRVNTEYYDGLSDEVGTVRFIDESDDGLPYRIAVDENDSYGDWYRFAEVSALDVEPTPERVDHTELVNEADEVIRIAREYATQVAGDLGWWVLVMERLRDALVEESYKEGK